MMSRSVVGKLWLAIVVLVMLVMFFLGLFLSKFFEDFYFALRADELTRDGEKMAEMIVSGPGMQWEEEISMISRYIDARITITDRRGLVKAQSAEDLTTGEKLIYPDVDKILNGEIVRQRGNIPGIDVTVIYVGVPIKVQNDVIGAIFLSAPVEPVTQTIHTVQKYILFGGLGTILLATILAFLLSKRISKPILDMNRVAMEMAKGNFSERVGEISDDEIGLLGKTLNYLSAELQDSIEALSNGKEQLENILTSMSDAVITFDEKGNVLLMNQRAREMSGAAQDRKQEQEEELENWQIDSLPFGPDLKEQYETALAEKKRQRSDIEINGKVYKTSMTLLRSNEEIRGVVAVLHDMTREYRLEQLRREFVANVSHELRSPLSLLQGYVEALADGLAEDEEARTKYLKIVLDETLRLKRLVNDLLDLTQLETGNLALKFEEVSLPDLVLNVTGRFKPLVAEQHQNLETHIQDNLPPVWGDEDRLQQVLVNLLDNAVKYTPPGGSMSVSAAREGETVRVTVTNSGPPIPREDLTNIWRRFYKVDKSRTRGGGAGTGLGLAIVKNIIQAHGGDVGVTSEPGQGTVFFFVLSAAQTPGKR